VALSYRQTGDQRYEVLVDGTPVGTVWYDAGNKAWRRMDPKGFSTGLYSTRTGAADSLAQVAPKPQPAKPKTASEDILSKVVHRSVYFERVKNAEVRKVVGFLNSDVIPDLTAKIEARLDRIQSRGFDTGVDTTARYQYLKEGIREIVRQGMAQLRAKTKSGLYEIGKAEAEFTQAELGKKLNPFGFESVLPAPQTLRSIVQEEPVLGAKVTDWFKGIAADTEKRIVQSLRVGLVEGQTVDQMVTAIRGTKANNYEDGILQTTRHQAAAIVRTSANHVVNRASEATYAENKDVIKGVKIVATLDEKTSAVCRAEDGKVYPINEGPRPPFHPNCRSKISPVLKSWKELGIDLKEAPEGTRASMDGQVPANLTYNEWLTEKDKTDPGLVEDILGKKKAELWRSGEVTLGGFVNDAGKELTLKQLAEKTGTEVKKTIDDAEFEAILEQARAEAEQIILQAQAEADSIMKDAEDGV
jgi:SPP1 gp7 family putative phage head morphogenesis protein